MTRPIYTTVTLAAAAATGVCASQTLVAAGNLVINGTLATAGVANLGNPARVSITSVGNDTGITWTVTGRPRIEQGTGLISETITGAAAGNTVTTTQDFLTVTSIRGSGAAAGAVTAGRALLASSPWVVWSQHQDYQQIAVAGFVLSGAPTWAVEVTFDDPFGTWNPPSVPFARPLAATVLQAQSASANGVLVVPVRASRVTLTAAGTVQVVQTQQGK